MLKRVPQLVPMVSIFQIEHVGLRSWVNPTHRAPEIMYVNTVYLIENQMYLDIFLAAARNSIYTPCLSVRLSVTFRREI